MANNNISKPASPASTGPAGPLFEGKVAAHYLLTMLCEGEPRGLPGSEVKAVKFQAGAAGVGSKIICECPLLYANK